MYRIRTIGRRGVLFSTDTIPGCVTHAYLIQGKKKNYLIDTGLGSATAQYIKGHIKEKCPNETVIINTHYHWDHIWGNVGFDGNRIFAHRSANALIERHWNEMEQKYGKWKEGIIGKVLPDTPIDDHFNFPEDGIEVFHSPGHTGDSLSVYDRLDRVLHVGDNMETLVPEIYDTKENYRNTLETYLGYDFSFCIGGHNGNVKRADILAVLKAPG